MKITSTALAVAVVLALAGCGGGGAAAVHHPPKPKPTPSVVAVSYPNVELLIADMAVHGALCSGVTFMTGGTIAGATDPFVDCTGTGETQSDTVIVVFDDQVDALAYADDMIATSTSLNLPVAEVVGPNWTVNTTLPFAAQVLKAVGGELIT